MNARARKKREFVLFQIFLSASLLVLLILGAYLLVKILLGLMLIGYLYLEISYFVNRRRIFSLKRKVESNPSSENFERIINSFISIYDYGNALTYSERAISKYPNNALLLTWRAVVFRFIDQDERAIPLIKKALELDPHNEFILDEASILESTGYKVFD